jgi:hypothetical protein
MKTIARKYYLYKRSSNYRDHVKNNVLLLVLAGLVLVAGYIDTLIIGG